MRITPLVEHWRRREAVWLYKIRNSVSAIPQYVKDLIPFKDLTEVKRLRRPVSIDFAPRTNIGKETLAFRLRELFSKLEDLIKSSLSLFTFQMNLRSICLSEWLLLYDLYSTLHPSFCSVSSFVLSKRSSIGKKRAYTASGPGGFYHYGTVHKTSKVYVPSRLAKIRYSIHYMSAIWSNTTETRGTDYPSFSKAGDGVNQAVLPQVS